MGDGGGGGGKGVSGPQLPDYFLPIIQAIQASQRIGRTLTKKIFVLGTVTSNLLSFQKASSCMNYCIFLKYIST